MENFLYLSHSRLGFALPRRVHGRAACKQAKAASHELRRRFPLPSPGMVLFGQKVPTEALFIKPDCFSPVKTSLAAFRENFFCFSVFSSSFPPELQIFHQFGKKKS